LLIAAGVFYAGAFLCLIIAFSSVHATFFGLMVMTGGIGIGLILLDWNIRLRLLGWVGCVIVLLAFVASGGKLSHSWWTHDRFDVIKQGVNWYNYRPFAPKNKLVTVSVSEEQKMSGELPRIDGAYALYPVYAAAVQAIFPKNDYSMTVETNGSDVIFRRLLKNETDMIFSLAPSAMQLADAKAAGLSYIMTPFMREAFVFYVNAKNPVSNVSREQIRGIYSGKITNWKELGAAKRAKIIPFQRNAGSGSQTTLEAIMGDIPVMPPLKEDRRGGMGDIIKATADYRNYKGAIGFSFRYFATEMIQNEPIKLLSIDGIAPSRENILNGSYPFIVDAYIITTKPPTGNVQKFIEFILSPQGREIVEKTGYVFL
jgi:phosphate transport system substrate-binding protein